MADRPVPYDCYSTLGLAPGATPGDVGAAFRRLSGLFQGRYRAAIADAYQTLRDPQSRAAHDRALGHPEIVAADADGSVTVPLVAGVAVGLRLPGQTLLFDSVVVDVEEAGVVVSAGSVDGVALIVHPGQLLVVEVGAIAQSHHVVEVRRGAVTGRLYVLRAPGEVEKIAIQRRRHVRLPVLLVVRVQPAAGADGSKGADGGDGWLPARSSDISAGGLSLATPEVWEPGTVVDVRLALPHSRRWIEVDTPAEVVRVAADQDDGDVRHYGLQFQGLNSGEEDRITAAVLWAGTQAAQ